MLLAGFFDQFGLVTRLRVSRNKKTGKAKHYAFVEFQSPEVAAIAADAMDGSSDTQVLCIYYFVCDSSLQSMMCCVLKIVL